MFEIAIPKTSIYKGRHSAAFQWTITFLNEPKQKRRFQYSSSNRYEEIGNVKINGYAYEKIILDFENGKLHIALKQKSTDAITNLLNALTIHTSLTSRMYCINSKRKRPSSEK